MKIKSIHIYGFGQFENKVIEMHPAKTLDVFYGHNEAGKSTIMAFIHAIFFGFPARNQTENRYEPKSGAKYGGKMTIEMTGGKIITIERIGGRSTGELTIYNEDGSISSENELQYLFKGLDRALYQAIFSFGFKGLQAIENVTSEELSHYLFTAGTTGSQALFELEKKINKRLDELYKPSGRKPLLNEKLHELEQLRNEVRKWDGKVEVYNKYVEEQEALKNKTTEVEEKIVQLQALVKEYDKKLMLKPHIEERKKWQIQLSQIEDYEPFPVNGLERLQQLQHEVRPLKARESSVAQKISELHSEINGIVYQEEYINLEAKVRALKEKQKVYEMQEIEREKAIISLHHEQSEINTIIDKLGLKYNEDIITKIDTSMGVKEQLKELTTKQERLKDQKGFLDEQFNKAKADLELSEKNYQTLKKQGQKTNPIFSSILFLAVLAAGIIFWVLSNSIYPLLITALLLIGLFLNRSSAKKGSNQQVEREQGILKQKEQLFEDVLKQYERWEQELHQAEHDLSNFCSQQKLPSGLPVSHLLSAFEWMEELKRRIRTKSQLQSELHRLEKALSLFQADLAEVILACNLQINPGIAALNEIMKIVETEKDKKSKVLQLKEKLQEYCDERSMLEQQISYLETEINQLYSSANVEDEGAFRQKGKANEQHAALKAKLQSIESYLQSVLKAGEERYLEEVEQENIGYEEMIEKIKAELTSYQEELKRMQIRMADIKVEIKNLEEGTTYSELVHRYEALKAEFQEEAGQWAVYRVAKDLIDRTKGYYREVRLPKVIKTAQAYFSFLTFAKYPLIFAPTEDRGFIVERQDGFRFKPNELSQATTEQLYLSLRLALANSFHALTPLPIIIDDSFVNFDIERTKRALQLIREISKDHQILFFTCHKHIADLFDRDEVINL